MSMYVHNLKKEGVKEQEGKQERLREKDRESKEKESNFH